MSKPWLLAVMGSTGAGKTGLAEAIAARTGAQLINSDAFQIYRGMDIGTAKPRDKSKYKLLDLCTPNDTFGVGEWVKQVSPILENLWETGQSAVIVGGTGLYVRSLMEQYEGMHGLPDPALRESLMEEERQFGYEHMVRRLQKADSEALRSIDLANPIRVRRALEKALDPKPLLKPEIPPFNQLKVSLRIPSEFLDSRLQKRVEQMWKAGWPQETATLLSHGFTVDSPGFRAIGYHQVSDFLEGSLGEEEAKTLIFSLTRRYAKRQRTWLRGEPRLRSFELADASETSQSVVVNDVLDLLNHIETE